MNRSLATAAALAACLLAAAPAAPAQQPLVPVPFNGTEGFSNILHGHGLTPLKNITDLVIVPPGDTVLIVFRDLRPLNRLPGGLRKFLDDGGAVLIATEQRDPLRDLNIRVNGRGVLAPPGAGVANVDECPLIKEFADPGHPIFKGIDRGIATNLPSYFDPYQGDLQMLARFPPRAVDQLTGNVGELPFIYGTPARAAAKGRPRILVMAGHNVFTNGMMGRSDNHNWEFAWNCVQWLTKTAKGKRKHALFFEDSRPVTEFNLPLLQPPMPPLKAINQLLRGLENENWFNGLILGSVARERILRYLFLGVTALLVIGGLYRLARAYHRTESPPPLVAAEVEKASSTLPPVARRHRAAQTEGHCGEAARDLTRHCFEGTAAPGDTPRAPPVVVRGGRRLRREVERLWRLAYDDDPPAVVASEFPGLLAALARVRDALDDGSVRFEANGRQ